MENVGKWLPRRGDEWGQAELLMGLTQQMPSVLQLEVGEEADLAQRTAEA